MMSNHLRSRKYGVLPGAALLLAVFPAAHAQSSVSIYGVLDVGVTYISNVGGGSLRKMDSGITTPSRLGFRGTEDLGGGLSAIFTLEMRPRVDNGTVFDPFFNRASFVGLKSAQWGTVTFGRQFDFFNTALPPDSTPFIAGGTNAGFQGFSSRTGPAPAVDTHNGAGIYDNTVKWEHSVGPWSGGLMYGLGPETGGKSMKSAYAKYVADNWQLGVGWGRDNYTTATLANQVFAIRGLYRIGQWTLIGNYAEGRETVTAGSKARARPLEFGAVYDFTPAFSLGAGVGYARNTNRAGVDATLTQPYVGARYRFSKQTAVYAVGARNHSSNPAAIPSTVGLPGGSTGISSTDSQTAVRVGIVTRF